MSSGWGGLLIARIEYSIVISVLFFPILNWDIISLILRLEFRFSVDGGL